MNRRRDSRWTWAGPVLGVLELEEKDVVFRIHKDSFEYDFLKNLSEMQTLNIGSYLKTQSSKWTVRELIS